MAISREEQFINDPRLVAARAKAEFIDYIVDGNVSLKAGEVSAAINSYKSAIQLNPNYYVAYTKLGHAFFKKEAWPEAAAALKKSFELNPSQFDILYMLSACYERLDLKELAEETLQLAKSKGKSQRDIPKRISYEPKEKKGKARKKRRRRVSLSLCIKRALYFIATKPTLIMPFFVFYMITSGLTLLLNYAFFGSIMAKFPPLNLNDKAQVLYYITVSSFHLLVLIPLIASGMYKVHSLYRSRTVSFSYSIKQSYKHLPSLILSTMFAAVMLGGIGIAVLALGSMFAGSGLVPVAALNINKIAALLAMGLFAPFFAFVFQSVIVENKSFEDSIALSIRTGAKRYLSVLILLAICVSPFLTVLKLSYSSELTVFLLVGLLKVPMLSFAVTALTVYFLEANGHKIRTKQNKSKENAGNEEPAAVNENGYELIVDNDIAAIDAV